jgi:hypothetical protein
MNIQAEKEEIMKMIMETNNPIILQSIKGLFYQERNGDFWETLTHEQKDETIKGVSELENGDVVDYEVFMKKHR